MKNSTKTCSQEDKRSSMAEEESQDIRPTDVSVDVCHSFQIGERVSLHSLETAKYNGKHGIVVSLPTASDDRYGIRVDGKKATLAIRSRNLSFVGKTQVETSSVSSNGIEYPFEVGDRVVLHNLQTAKYNGRSGVIVSTPEHGEERYGVRLDGEIVSIAVRRHNLRVKTTQELKEELSRHESYMRTEDVAQVDQLRMLRLMVDQGMTEEHQIKIYGRKIEPLPDFRAELLHESGNRFPVGVDPAWANGFLQEVFENAHGLPHHLELHLKQEDWEPEKHEYIKRLGTSPPSKVKWYFKDEKTIGSVYDLRCATPYTDLVRHSYSNQAYRNEKLHRGTVHVAIGFVDLGLLFAADLDKAPNNSKSPLHFVGIEMSAYAVAKTHVIWEMLLQAPPSSPDRDNHLRYIVQVWFSAWWEAETQRAVKKALSSLLSKSEAYHPKVKMLLLHWAQAKEYPLRKARKGIADATTDIRSAIAHLIRKQDRIAMAKYELTGDFGLKSEPTCGNIIMFDCPDGTPPLLTNERIFSALNWREVAEILQSDKKSKMTVIEAAEEFATRNISKMASWAQSKEVTVELKCAKFQDEIENIAARKPWTMSWSNIPDYVDHADFHSMARRCSVHGDTVHYGYSMNWIMDVYGVHIVDYSGKALCEVRENIIKAANESIATFYRVLKWDKYLRLPPPTNPLNTTSTYGLELGHYRKWGEYFFQVARKGGCCSVANFEHAFGTPLSFTGNSTVAFTWTYDADITFPEAYTCV